MNYRHAFHAGNFADVLKHAALALALARMTAKAKPLRVIDTHAGTGAYRLDGAEAQRTGEWRAGIGRLVGPEAPPLPPAMATLLEPYLARIRALNDDGQELAAYPGSPALALGLLRPDDRLVACELHPDDATALKRTLRGDRRAKVLEMDGWTALRSLLPPKERRGLVLIDPPFEAPGELGRLIEGLGDGLARFGTGTYMMWLPVKEPRQIAAFEQALARLGIAKLLWAELRVEEVALADRLAGTALAIVNPPFGLEAQLGELLPFLAERLATGPGARFRLAQLGRDGSKSGSGSGSGAGSGEMPTVSR